MIDLLAGLPEPAPKTIRALRLAAGLTQAECAALVGLADRARWAEYERGVRSPDAARWALFLLLVGQHPAAQVIAR